ncbi:MAG: PilZ domain-containing protein [Magnetococcales bacterium]|nr:PilZ domain-containing protein [Magnetococcales bacterium]
MSDDRREHLRITLSIKSAIFFADGFLINVPVVNLSSGGIRLEIPMVDRLSACKEGILRLYFQPEFIQGEHSYMLEIPCTIVWNDGTHAGIQFRDPDIHTRETLGDLLNSEPSQEREHG